MWTLSRVIQGLASRNWGTMVTMTAVEVPGRFTRADFESLPEGADDGLPYELLS